jgi:hypothetical protein
MIEFPCHCGHPFSVGEELAGSVMQCPQCKLLVDVPMLSDLQSIDDQGIYKLDASPDAKHNQERVDELTQAFTRDHYDDEREPIDLRQSFGKQSEILPPTIEPGAPKYDPVTGELIRPLDVKTDSVVNPNALPTARQARKLRYSDTDIPSPLEFLAIPLRLLQPLNLLVMFFIFLGHLLGMFMMLAIAMFYLILAPFWLALHAAIIAHFANVIDETGPTERSELPTPLRHLGWHEDTFGPFSRVVVALTVCYGPALLLLFYAPIKNIAPMVGMLSAAMAIAGTIFFPAALLTTTTSGSIVNLRPDRIIGTAIICGPDYIVAVVMWVIGGTLWIGGTIATNIIAASILNKAISMPAYLDSVYPYLALIGGIFVMHYFCWHLGTLYRRHHDRFPWMYQRHHHPPGVPIAKGFEVTQKRPPRRVIT